MQSGGDRKDGSCIGEKVGASYKFILRPATNTGAVVRDDRGAEAADVRLATSGVFDECRIVDAQDRYCKNSVVYFSMKDGQWTASNITMAGFATGVTGWRYWLDEFRRWSK